VQVEVNPGQSRCHCRTEFEGSVRCKDGSRRWVVWNSERLADFRGQLANLFVGLDRTELKEVQQRAWQKERLAELGVLASGLAHEIRNPLNTIRFNLLNVQDGIAQAQTDHAEVAAMVKDIADEVDRLEEIMRDFLRLARPDPAQLEAVAVRELLERVARLVDGPCRAQPGRRPTRISSFHPSKTLEKPMVRAVFG
jgi:signal transduction histidine kinase